VVNNEVCMTDVNEDVEFRFARGTTHKQQVFYAKIYRLVLAFIIFVDV